MADETAAPTRRVFERETLEFERVAFFSDAIFAIAMTLLVVDLDAPKLLHPTNGGDLWEALGDMQSQLIMFFISFAVLGGFWLAHHRYFGRLATIDRQATAVNLLYLAFIAFLPFPSSVLGAYSDNPVAVAVYACCIAAIALVDSLMAEIAGRHGLYRRPPSAVVIRWQRVLSLIPAAYFLASVPLALVSASAALYSWIGLFPLSVVIQRRVPAEVTEFFDE
jgi:uncharacterized membrane protein